MLTRWRGAPAIGACLTEGERASSPVEKAFGETLVLAPLGVQSPSFPLTAPSYVVGQLRRKRKEATSMDDWRLVREENLSPDRGWEKFWS